MAVLRITQIKSLIGRPKDQRGTVKALGLKRIRHTVEQADTPEIRGMLAKVGHLVTAEPVEEGQKETPKQKVEKSK